MAEYVRLRAPSEHGQTFELPKLSAGANVLESNLNLILRFSPELNAIRELARSELLEMAVNYTSGYLDADWLSDLKLAIETPIVMSGHQPSLFHPGVWFKNFALSSLGANLDGIAINLVVDNDLCGSANVLVPQQKNDGSAKLLSIPFDQPFTAVPYEMRSIHSRETFESFASSLATSISSVVDAPIVFPLWKEVLNATSNVSSMPASLAAGRHRMEDVHGLRTLELPVSVLSSSRAFASFFALIAHDAKRFATIHNNELVDYRLQHRIRSRSHPVPDLTNDDDWQELPFWFWTRHEPVRRRLFARTEGDQIQLSDRQQWSVSISRSALVDSFQELNQPGSTLCIRPRALTTTMFARIFASDLFVHGIGGAKYDQLNDDIMRQFFNIEPPKYFTTTATMKLPFEFQESSKSALSEIGVQLRNARYHPELLLPNHELAVEKSQLVQSGPAPNCKKQWHDRIDSINQKLFQELSDVQRELASEVERVKSKIPTSKILGSREYSFALFPEHLIDELKQMASN